MNLGALLTFAPLAVGLIWLAYLLFKKDLPSSNLGGILTYFVGVIIIFVAVGWLIDFFVIDWANDRLQRADDSTTLQEFINTSEGILEESFTEEENGGANNNFINTEPTAVPSNPNPVQNMTPGPVQVEPGAIGSQQHTVRQGETLSSIARQYNTTAEAIMQANNIVNPNLIYPNQVLVIP